MVVPNGYKMKWHNMGDGAVQIRLCVAVLDHAYLCQAYVKDNATTEHREAAKFMARIKSIKDGRYYHRGTL